MNKREKAFWILAYAVTAVLTLLPFFQVGFTNGDEYFMATIKLIINYGRI